VGFGFLDRSVVALLRLILHGNLTFPWNTLQPPAPSKSIQQSKRLNRLFRQTVLGYSLSDQSETAEQSETLT
jgi:hypothetical protein